MSAITDTVEIARSPQEVFEYSVDPDRRTEWQEAVQEISMQTPRPPAAGSRVREVRRVPGPGGPRAFVWEITAYEPASRWSFRGLDGPVRPYGTMRFTPLDGGARTRVDFEIDFEGRGLGKLFAVFARRGAPQQVRSDLQGLRRVMESGASGAPPPPVAP
jgi:uncharacterized protein YndB with AHSA1/START domain